KGWTETNPEILRTLALETGSNNITLGLIIVIASFGVISSLNLSVIGATTQIGMLRAMGATVSGIRLIFLLESSLLGFLGALVGTLLGVLLAIWIGNYELPTQTLGGISTIPAVIRPEDLFIIITAVFLLNLLGGIYPAQQAAKLDPVKALSTR
ncbi:MAG: FtsX-like permease family protein, partial [Methanosarcinaceae archaeon]|nr:FtsX-like permease family protein [Methanosarcinaceae archaeon]